MRVKNFLGILMIVFLIIAIAVIPVNAAAPEVLASPDVAVIAQDEAAVPSPIDDIYQQVIGGGALMWFITGLVTYLKKFGLKGNWLTASAMVLGLLLAGGYKILLKPPTDPIDWFFAALYGLGCGLLATGVYDSYGKNSNSAG